MYRLIVFIFMVELQERAIKHFTTEWDFEYNPNTCVLVCKEKDFVVDSVPEHMVPQTMEMLRLLHRIYSVIQCSYQDLKAEFIQQVLRVQIK